MPEFWFTNHEVPPPRIEDLYARPGKPTENLTVGRLEGVQKSSMELFPMIFVHEFPKFHEF